MKKIIYLSFTLAIVFTTIYSCKKTATVAFTNATMKPWFDSHCASCHASGTSNSSDWKYDASDDQTIQKYINDINSEVITKKTMPQGGMAQTERDKFKTWYDAGHASN